MNEVVKCSDEVMNYLTFYPLIYKLNLITQSIDFGGTLKIAIDGSLYSHRLTKSHLILAKWSISWGQTPKGSHTLT